MQIENTTWNKIFKLRDNFIRETKHRTLYSYQKTLSNAVIKSIFLNDGKTIIGEVSRQAGKTTIITDTVVFLILFYFQITRKFNLPNMGFFNVGFFAPLVQQVRTSFGMVRDYLETCKDLGFDYTFDEFNANTINIHSNKYPKRMVYCFTASPTSHPESKTLNLIIYDEAQDLVDKQVDKAISPMGAHTNATEVFIGVAGYQRCKFWRFLEELPKEQKIIIPEDMVLKEREERYKQDNNPIHLNYKRHIEKKKREIREDSDEYKTNYKLVWILERGQFITYEALMALEKEYIIYQEYPRIQTLYAGIDWGKMHDSTVFTIIDEEGKVVAWYEFFGDDYASQIEQICYLIGKYYLGLKVIHCDSTATQDMAVDMLTAKLRDYKLNPQVIGVKFGIGSKNEMYKNLDRLMKPIIIDGKIIEEAKIMFPVIKEDSPEFVKELQVSKEKFIKQFLDLQKEIRKAGQWDCHHPDGPHYHDDFPDSLALACMAFRQIIQYTPSIA